MVILQIIGDIYGFPTMANKIKFVSIWGII